MKKQIDLNCDLGEGIGNEALLMPYLSSCNIACGGHAGDPELMMYVAKLAKKYNVKIGAHPSFPDKQHFGRQTMNMEPKALFETLKTQITTLIEILNPLHLKLHHVKPHGALYNMAVIDKEIAKSIVNVILDVNEDLKLYAPFQSEISKVATEKGIQVLYEGFADRFYNEDLTLVSRKKEGAVIADKNQIFDQVFQMISEGKVTTKNGVEVALKVDTICVHGDHQNVLKNLEYINYKLKANSIKIL